MGPQMEPIASVLFGRPASIHNLLMLPFCAAPPLQVREAAAPLDRWQQSYQRFVQVTGQGCKGQHVMQTA